MARLDATAECTEMRLGICFLLSILMLAGATKPKPDVACVDVPRVTARKRVAVPPLQKLELSEAMGKELSGVLFGVSLTEALDLKLDFEAPSEDGATQLEKMVQVLMSAQQLKSEAGQVIGIDLPRAMKVQKTGKMVRTTVSLTDAQLEKLLEARYGRRMVSEAMARLVYVHGLPGGTRSFAFGDSASVDLRR